VTALRKWGVPPGIFAAAVVVGALLIIHAAIVQGSTIAVDWVGRAPELLASFSDKLRSAFGPAFSLERLQSTFARSGGGPFDAGAVLQSTMNFLTPTIGELIVFLAALFFSLSGREELRRYLVFAFDDKETRLRTLRLLNNIERDLKSYMAVVAAINLVLALIVAATAFAVGLPNPLLWGIVAFALEFIPYVGPIAIYVALFLVGFATFGSLSRAVIAADSSRRRYVGGQCRNAERHRPPTDSQSRTSFPGTRVLDMALGPGRRNSLDASAHRRNSDLQPRVPSARDQSSRVTRAGWNAARNNQPIWKFSIRPAGQ
jgi:hypothetical protein